MTIQQCGEINEPLILLLLVVCLVAGYCLALTAHTIRGE